MQANTDKDNGPELEVNFKTESFVIILEASLKFWGNRLPIQLFPVKDRHFHNWQVDHKEVDEPYNWVDYVDSRNNVEVKNKQESTVDKVFGYFVGKAGCSR